MSLAGDDGEGKSALCGGRRKLIAVEQIVLPGLAQGPPRSPATVTAGVLPLSAVVEPANSRLGPASRARQRGSLGARSALRYIRARKAAEGQDHALPWPV